MRNAPAYRAPPRSPSRSNLLWELIDQLELENGKLWVYDIDRAENRAVTHDAIEALGEIIKDQIDRAR